MIKPHNGVLWNCKKEVSLESAVEGSPGYFAREKTSEKIIQCILNLPKKWCGPHVCVCMYVCTYICVYVHIHTHMYNPIYIYVFAYVLKVE